MGQQDTKSPSSCFSINKNLLPLKFTLFFFSASAFSVLPYLTIHMKDIGISDIDVALIYTVLPFCVFVAPPIVGFLADKLGNYTRVLLVNVVLCGVFHTSLLAVPHTIVKTIYPPTTAVVTSGQVLLNWSSTCPDTNISTCSLVSPLPPSPSFSLTNCTLTCQGEERVQGGSPEERLCALLPGAQCKPNPVAKRVRLKGLLSNNVTETGCGTATLQLQTKGDPYEATSSAIFKDIQLKEKCRAECQAVTNLVRQCGVTDNGNRTTTNSIYFVMRALATMALACVFIMLDAQTIQMCKMEEAQGNKGSYGRQILYKTLAQAIISPLVGVLMDKITYMTGSTNYLAPFLIHDLLLVATLVSVCFLNSDIGIPKGEDTMKGVKAICTNISILIFLVMMFVCGCMYGFVETFLFVFLKEDLNAPIYLLGLTITTGAIVSIPFLYYSQFLVEKFGMVNVITFGLLMYGVRYVGYSYISCAWYAFPFEALEVFTIFLLRVGMAEYVKVNAPPGTLATLNGMAGGAHFGFGKGVGALLGGVFKDQWGLSMAFRSFGIASFVFGVIYAVFYRLYGRTVDQRMKDKLEEEKEKEKLEPFLVKNPIVRQS